MKNNSLNYDKIIKTIELLEHRIGERFPKSGLRNVCHDFLSTSKLSQKNIEWIAKPNFWLRFFIYGIISLTLLVIVYSILNVNIKLNDISITDIVALFESITNQIVLLGAAIFFLITIENRIKRSKAIKSLNELRALIHVVDMHQLTKDPMINFENTQNTTNSPKRKLNKYELQRYLNYCSEMLSLIAKVSVLYSQSLPDDVIIRITNEIELLSSGISRKIWQKLIILNEFNEFKR